MKRASALTRGTTLVGVFLFATWAGCDAREPVEAVTDTAGEGPELTMEAAVDDRADQADPVEARAAFLPGREVLAFVEDAHGGFAALVQHAERPDDLGLAVYAVYPHAPLVAASFMEKHDALDAFLAVSEPDAALPEAVTKRLSQRQRDIANDRVARAALRERNLREMPELGGQLELPEDAELVSQAATCSTTFRNWAESVFGGDGTCGQLGNGTGNFSNQTIPYNYGVGGDFTLGASDHASCRDNGQGFPDGSCVVIDAELTYRRQRGYNIQGNGSINASGHRQHYGLANCTGNGSVDMVLTRDGVTKKDVAIGVGGMLHFFYGTDLPSTRTTINHMAEGAWNDEQGQSGSTYLSNAMSWTNNAGADDRIIICGDVQLSITMLQHTGDCPNATTITLCENGAGDCDGECWEHAD